MNSKVKAYIGFALRKNAVIFGYDNIVRSGKSKAVLLGADASEKTKKEIKYFCRQKHVPLLEAKSTLEEIFGSKNVKVFAVTDAELARAILQNSDEDFKSVEVV